MSIATSSPDIRLLIIDPQNDFCDLPADATPPGASPSLPVPGAHADMVRLAGVIGMMGQTLAGIGVTLDSHHRLDIAHPTFWQQGDGSDVAPFTEVTAAEVRAGRVVPRDAASLPRALTYLDELERRGRYRLMVWPVHCEMGTWGHQVHAAVGTAVKDWEAATGRSMQVWRKGMNAWTEHYSAVLAEVPDDTDPGTQVNQALVDWAAAADVLVVAGEAGSHCVKATTEHLLDYLPAGHARRMVLLTDCMSPVGQFEAAQAAFLSAMQGRGVHLTDSQGLARVLGAVVSDPTRNEDDCVLTNREQHGV
ncbi:cysteine hydrolase [Pigmentiphaga litoralis]|uniref:cysteine hydrolase n=1 Tax=Pigmentiphaga litoralis TaxID=516702 RepID=UPI003B42D57C